MIDLFPVCFLLCMPAEMPSFWVVLGKCCCCCCCNPPRFTFFFSKKPAFFLRVLFHQLSFFFRPPSLLMYAPSYRRRWTTASADQPSLSYIPSPNARPSCPLAPHLFPPQMLQFLHFLRNFEDAEGGFFWEMSERWTKWVDMHQHLPYSMARLACSSFYEGKWAGADKAYEHAVGQEFARALLVALWPEQYESAEWREWEEEHDFSEFWGGPLRGNDNKRER